MIPLPSTGAAILMVNDETALRKRLRESLEKTGFHVVEASGGSGQAGSIPSRNMLSILANTPVLRRFRGKSKVSLLIVSERPGAAPAALEPALVATEATPRRKKIFRCGPLSVDFANRVAKAEGRRLKLTITEFSVLRLLIERAGRVVTHREIVRKIWGCDLAAKIGCLRVFACSLREKLRAACSMELLVTEPGVGYRLAFPE